METAEFPSDCQLSLIALLAGWVVSLVESGGLAMQCAVEDRSLINSGGADARRTTISSDNYFKTQLQIVDRSREIYHHTKWLHKGGDLLSAVGPGIPVLKAFVAAHHDVFKEIAYMEVNLPDARPELFMAFHNGGADRGSQPCVNEAFDFLRERFGPERYADKFVFVSKDQYCG